MDINVPIVGGITASFDDQVWQTNPSVGRRGTPFGASMSGSPIHSSSSTNQARSDFDWLLGELSSSRSDVLPLPGLVRVAGNVTRGPFPPVTITVDLAPDESAVLLVECEGVVAWQFPESADRVPTARPVRTVQHRQVHFRVQAPGMSTAALPQQRNVFVDWAVRGLRTAVLKFAAAKAAPAIVNRLDGNKRTGPVEISVEPDDIIWKMPFDFSEVQVPDRGARVLLFVHGTFSSTQGAFGDLCLTPWGKNLLSDAKKQYHALLGYDHQTLSVEPSENAVGLLTALQTLRCSEPPTIDIVCHSRGALVTRWLIEKLLPTAEWQPRIGKVIFAGGTNAGTEMARPENWHALLDLMTNLALAGRQALTLLGAPHVGFAAVELVGGLRDFVRYLVDVAVAERRAPGLAAMDPSGAFIAAINQRQIGHSIPSESAYFSIVSNFRATVFDKERHEPKEFPRRLALLLANGLVGALMQKASNDLVVNVGAMSATDAADIHAKGSQDFGTNSVVYHTNYFQQPETVDALVAWLGLPQMDAVRYVNNKFADRRFVEVPAGTLVNEAIRTAQSAAAHYVVFSRQDPEYPGKLYYAPSVSELQRLPLDSPIDGAPYVMESGRSRLVENKTLLRSLNGRTPPDSSFSNFARRAIVVEGGKPIGVIPELKPATDMLAKAANPQAQVNRGYRGHRGARDAVASEEPAATQQALPPFTEPVVCNAQAEMPHKVKVKTTVTVTVTLSAEQIAAASDGVLFAQAPTPLVQGPVTIEVLPRIGFELASSELSNSRVTLPGPPGRAESKVIDFELLATHEGQGEVWVIVRQGPLRAATLQLRPEIVAADAVLVASRMVNEGQLYGGDAMPAVTTLEITQQTNGNETRFRFSVNIPGETFNRFESAPIKGDIGQWVRALYEGIENAWLGSAGNQEIFHDNLKAMGAVLFRDLIPAPLAQTLWALRSEGRLETVLVCSDEPFVPWEIAYLDNPHSAGDPRACFFAQLGLCRWLYGAVPPPYVRVRPGRIGYVIPHYPEQRYRLTGAEQLEEPMLIGMGGRCIVPHYREVTAALQSGDFDLIHFACHGQADGSKIGEAALLLEGSWQVEGYVVEPLSATVVAYKAKLRGPEDERPIVVLNACQAGRLGFNLSSLGGFAPAFLGARVGINGGIGEAGVFIGALWSVGDEPASVFAKEFYRALEAPGGKSVASAVVAAREAARLAGDATWLAYVVYAHPNCLVEFTP